MSRGVSCHWWLEATKTHHSHACPGPGILNPLDVVARGCRCVTNRPQRPGLPLNGLRLNGAGVPQSLDPGFTP
jgi:hypothetical protein